MKYTLQQYLNPYKFLINNFVPKSEQLKGKLNEMNVHFDDYTVNDTRDYLNEDQPYFGEDCYFSYSCDLNKPIYLSVSFEYLKKENTLNGLYALIFLLKDYGLEFIYPESKKNWDTPHLHFTTEKGAVIATINRINNVIQSKPKGKVKKCIPNKIVGWHISDFLKLSPNSYTSSVLKSCFYIYYMENFIGYAKGKIIDWEKDALDSAYEGDSSNYWNLD
jgi:hypothetical protein